ncbi:DMT family transporter [Streptomyces winkii]|uniref:DMT family transporter n=1 Tax=Streptomyces winkii TaxID=3051178 RepID=UPI0028D5B0F8|nr:DMT family transporter [Streptomyces sp. DSM 40971]
MPPAIRTHLIGAGLVVMWSSGFIGAELGTREAPADTLLLWRFIAAAALLGAAGLVLRARTYGRRRPAGTARMPPRALAKQAAIGLLSQGVYLGAVYWAAESGVPAGTSALTAALQPLVAGALAGRLLGETVTRRQWAGLVLGLAGVAAVVRDDLASPASTAPPLAYLLPLVGMAGLLAASFLERRARHQPGPAEALPLHCLVSAVVFTGLAAGTGHLVPPPTAAFWMAVAWVVVLSTVGGYGFYWLSLRHSGVTRTSALIYLTPPTTVVWAYAMFGERPGAVAVAGMGIAVVGVLVAVRPQRVREAPPAKEPQSGAARYDRHDGNDTRFEPPAQHGSGGGGGDCTVPPGRLRTAHRGERKGPLR